MVSRYARLFICVVVTASATSGWSADDKPLPRANSDPAKDHQHPTVALGVLQRSHGDDESPFVLQSELDPLIREDGGGACPSAAAIDVLQTLRVMAGLDPLRNPHKVALKAFTGNKALLKGRLSNDDFVALLDSYQRYLGGSEFRVEVESAPNSGYRAHRKTWGESGGADLSVAPRQLKVVSYTVTDGKDQVLGRHFVLLKGSSDGQLEVVDPDGPAKDRRYVVEYKAGEKGAKARAFLNNPPDVPRRHTLTFEINTVFTVTLADKPAAPAKGVGRVTTVEAMNQKLDETAAALRDTKEFLDPRAWRKRTASFGLPGLDLPEEVGGGNWSAAKTLEVFYRAGYHNLNFRDVVGGAHVRPLLEAKSQEVTDIVRKVAKGEGYVAIAITEPEVGSNVPGIRSTSRKVDGGYRLTGKKLFNARLEQATHVILFVQGTTGKPGRLSVFVVPVDTKGLKFETLEAHGLKGNSYGGVSFEDLFVPEAMRVGEDGDGLKIFEKHFLYWRLMQAAAALGTGKNALDQMAERIKSREAFGGPIGRFTHLQQPIGQYTTELRMALALAREAAELLDRGDYKTAEPLIDGLKGEGVEMALRAVDAATRAFGGEGYSTRVDLGDRLKDLNGLRIADGTTDVMRMMVVRKVYGEAFWEMAVQPKREAVKPEK